MAGNGEVRGTTANGAYAARTPVPANGGIASTPDGSLYFPIKYGDGARLAHLTPDGRIHLMGAAQESDHLTIHGDKLWQVSMAQPGRGTLLTVSQTSLKDSQQTAFFTLKESTINSLSIVDEHGKPLPQSRLRELKQYWKGSIAGIRADGRPILVNYRGDMFILLGASRLQSWTPTGYEKALEKVARPDSNDASRSLRPDAVTSNGKNVTTILGDPGMIRLSDHQTARGVQYSWPPDHVRAYLHATDAVTMPDGSNIVVDGSPDAGATKRISRVSENGTVESLATAREQPCSRFAEKLDDVAAGTPTGIARRSNGFYVITDIQCGKVYEFKLAG